MRILLLHIVLFAGLSFLFSSCDKPDNLVSGCTASAAGDTVMIGLNKPLAIFPVCMTDLYANVLSINDSRCPKGATCIWQGNLTAILKLGTQFTINLEQGKTKDTTYLNNAYSITLIDAIPFPSILPPITPGQSAQIRIIKK
jgi:hypothetical protein